MAAFCGSAGFDGGTRTNSGALFANVDDADGPEGVAAIRGWGPVTSTPSTVRGDPVVIDTTCRFRNTP